VVEEGRALLDTSAPGRRSRYEQKGFGQCRLAAPAMSDESDVADFLG
jgi:hypothetical protein